jgi:hypothetical protein
LLDSWLDIDAQRSLRGAKRSITVDLRSTVIKAPCNDPNANANEPIVELLDHGGLSLSGYQEFELQRTQIIPRGEQLENKHSIVERFFHRDRLAGKKKKSPEKKYLPS